MNITGNFYVNTTTYIDLSDIKDRDGSFINNAAVSAVLTERDGDSVAGGENIVFEYIIGSNGSYRATLPHTLPLIPFKNYTLSIRIVYDLKETHIVIKKPAVYPV